MEISIIPRWILKFISTDCLRQNNINILLSNLLIILVFVLFKNSLMGLLNLLPHFCLFEKLFHIDCPVCGTTRALCELSKGNIKNAVGFNLASIFVAVYLVFQIPLRLFVLFVEDSGKKVNLLSKYLSNAILVILVVSWLIRLFVH